jgi:RNA polymerase sigma factor (sigma-70 family)
MARRWQPLLERLARERYPQLIARATLLTGERATGEDLVQDALVATFSGRARFTTLAEAEQYVRRAMATRYVDRIRSSGRERAALRRVAAMPTPAAQIVPAGLARDLVAALSLLPPRERACVVLRHLEDMSTRETAASLGLSEGAVKRYLADGVAALAVAMGAEPGAYDTEIEPVRLVGQDDERKGGRR